MKLNPELQRLLFLKGRDHLPDVLFVAAECAPLSKTGGLADMAGALPRALAAEGFRVRVITPYHRCIKETYAAQVEHIAHFYVNLGWRHQYAGLERLELDGLTIYLIDSEFYFGGAIYRGGEAEVEQYAFFQRAVLEAIPLLDFAPEVLHCNDWHTAALPFLIKTQYAGRPQGALKTILTIHNLAYQGQLSFESAADLLGVESRWFGDGGLGHCGCANLLKGGILFADRVNTVSPSYADEIRTPAFGAGLHEVLRRRGSDVSGILNGLDTAQFDPAADPAVPYHYQAADTAARAQNKAALLAELGLDCSMDTPLVAMVSRMTAQKGFDLLLPALDELMRQDVCFVLLGSGNPEYENAMRGFERRYQGRLCAYIGYSEALARRIYAGADFLLMPSAFEPCGLSQLIAMRYGALPIVHEVGGLRDTVTPYNRYTGEGTGFSFRDYDRGALLGTVAYALATYRNAEAMQKLIYAAMTRDVSLAACAVDYGKLYLTVLDARQSALCHIPHDERYRSPFGAVKCGETVTLRLQAGDIADSAALLAGGEAFPMQPDGDGFFSVDYTAPAEPGLVYYSFRLPGDVYFGKNGVGSGEMHPWQLTVYDPAFATPDWAQGTVIYQIFPDRYAPGGTAFEKGVRHHRGKGRGVECHRSWDEPVKFTPTTRPDYYPDDFYGGTLEGIRARLPALQALGVGCIYLNPIFEADSNHRYNTADYLCIDPMLGTQAEFQALCADAKACGIRIVLDGVFSHTGDDSVYFNRYGRYRTPGAYQGAESPYYTWYRFNEFLDDYRCWWGFPSLPEVDEQNPDWQEFVVTGKNAVMKKWLRQGAGGWRLDVADELPDDVISLMRRSVKETKPDALLIGEVWEDATNKVSYGEARRYALGGGLDSVMNYPLRTALLSFALGWTDAAALRDFLLGQKLNYAPPMYHVMMNHLGTHDTARLRTVLGTGDEGGGLSRAQQAAFTLSEEQDARGRALQRLCAALQFSLPGMPCIYYGDEEGMQGFRDPFCRAPYTRAAEDVSLRDFYSALAKARNRSEILRRGDAAFAAYGRDVIAVLRYANGKAVLTVVNRGLETTVSPTAADFLGLCKADAATLSVIPALELPAQDFVTVEF
ncbi:MAG: glycogen/starch synthase [Oscillospiraceae bacterium]|nr:glycogen/starch synthase [Oscillospiraceae bacterium]